MCGRYAVSHSADELAEEFGVDRIDVRDRLEPDWNVAPTKDVYAVLTRRRRDAPDDPPERRLRVLRWGVMAMAGLYEIWRDPTVADDDDPAAFRWTSVVLTTTAEDDIGQIHDRAPMIVRPEDWAVWLDPGTEDVGALRRLLVPAAPGLLEAYPVSTEVNKVDNNGPQLVEPLPVDEDESALF
jgi:putative SOS response-associated peptidase YedK